jgi:AcrR family transcriptional regulator
MPRALDAEKRTRILLAAREKFSEKGYNQTPMSDIAQEAGIAHGTLYLYYPAKEALAQALCEDFFERLGRLVLPRAEAAENLEDLVQVLALALDFIRGESDLMRMLNLQSGLSNEPGSEPEKTVRVKFYSELSRVLEAKMEQGIVARYEPEALAVLVAGLVEWVAEAALVQGFGSLEQYEPTLFAFVRNALAPRQTQS